MLSLVSAQNDASLGETLKAKIQIFYDRFVSEKPDIHRHMFKKFEEAINLDCTTLVEPQENAKPRGRMSTKEKNAAKVRNATKVKNSTLRDPSEFEHFLASLQPSLETPKAVKQKPWRNPRAKEKVAVQVSTCHFIDQFPEPIRPYIELVKDVESDGNCGFRAISAFINEDCNEHEWKQLRIDLLRELDANFDLYKRVALRSGRAWELHCILNWDESPTPQAKWMTMPDMGHLIASTYNCVLIYLSKLQCLTFLPLRSKPLPSMKRKVIAIGFVDGGHFVQVFLKKGSPIPPIACSWTIYRDSIAKNWDVPYVKAIQKFNGNDVATKKVIDVD